MNIFLRHLLSIAVLCAALASVPASAQVPSSAEPSRVRGQIAPMPTASLPEVSGKTASGAEAAAPAGAETVTFTLRAVTVEGQTVYDAAALASFYSGMIGKVISLADVFVIAERMTAKYRNDGYILTQMVVPPQTIEGGHVRLQVVEGFIDNVFIQGDTGKNLAWLAGFAEKIRASRPLNSKVLERYMLLINDLAGIGARSVLVPSATPGATDMMIIAGHKRYDAFFQADNRGTYFLGPLQASLGGRLNNALGWYEGLNMQLAVAPDNWGDDKPEMFYFGFNWEQPINHEGTKVTVGGSFTDTGPEYTLTPLDVDGIAKAVNLELSHPFIRSRSMNLYGSVKFNFLNSDRNDNLGLGGAHDKLRVLRAGGTFQFTDGWLGINTVSGELSKGVDIMGASDKSDPFKSRALGDPEFFKGWGEISRVQRITNKLEAFLSASGQLSANTLLASEEFGVGGVNYGSAYDNSEITGEDGFAARFEMRVNNPVQLPVNLLQLYGFYDGGQVNDPDNAVVKARRRSIVSAGGGARVNVNDNFAGTLEVAVPLTAEVLTESDNDPRIFTSITGKF